MRLSKTARRLYDEISELTIIDAHEHLPTEAEYLAAGYSGLNMFSHYFRLDLLSAGLDREFFDRMRTDVTTPVSVWWPKIKPFYEASKHTSYARALRITARDVFGIDDLNDRTIAEFAAKVTADNAPGVYRRTLQERCKARFSITCVDRADFPDDPGLRGITTLVKCFGTGNGYVRPYAERAGRAVKSLEDLAEIAQSMLRAELAKGAVGFKTSAASFGAPDAAKAAEEFRRELDAGHKIGELPALRDWLFDKCLDVARDADVPVAVHTGYWGDFRTLDPKFLLGFAARRSDVRFDLFHLGVPFWREAALIGKTLPNVTLNLCWCPIVSQVTTGRMLDELIDLVPANKVIAFGGDYRVCVQKAWGHLVMARECVASALARRVDAGDFDRDEALRLAKLWFCDNPARIYKLEAQPARPQVRRAREGGA